MKKKLTQQSIYQMLKSHHKACPALYFSGRDASRRKIKSAADRSAQVSMQLIMRHIDMRLWIFFDFKKNIFFLLQ